ncbi:DUF998 domain-containing protein [Aquisalimonas sp.]|uniref:DUF998 domain-containing protein n=1 Tax=Aquisalimonas sp. TaxID=1872621 RepID=UPI0034542B52
MVDDPNKKRAIGVLLCLLASAIALGTAPFIMPEDYDWISHTTSESAAQQVEGAWLARLGFLLFGIGVLWLSAGAGVLWGRWGTLLHVAFGLFMIAAGVFSASSWDPAVPHDAVEDALHSMAATAMGFAFAFAIVAIVVRRRKDDAQLRHIVTHKSRAPTGRPV